MCLGKLTAAENLHKMVDPMRLFRHRNLLHHLAALVVNQKVRLSKIEDLHFSWKLSRLPFHATTTFLCFSRHALQKLFLVNGLSLFLLAAVLPCFIYNCLSFTLYFTFLNYVC
jgi:hypothetical protein